MLRGTSAGTCREVLCTCWCRGNLGTSFVNAMGFSKKRNILEQAEGAETLAERLIRFSASGHTRPLGTAPRFSDSALILKILTISYIALASAHFHEQ